MSQYTFGRFLIGVVVIGLFLTVRTSAAEKDKPKEWPKGSEKAVAAVQKEYPKGELEDVAEPRGFGSSGGKGDPLYWNVQLHVSDKKLELAVTPEGTIVRVPTAVEVKDLPKPVAEGIAKAAPDGKVKSVEKSEMRATMKYVAIDKPEIQQYVIDVAKDDKRSRITMSGDGGNAKVAEIKEDKKDDKGSKSDEKEKEIDIPEKAAKAVKAIKAVYPDAVVKEITHEVFDDGTGEIEILTYEIEFISKGVKHEMVASPDGVIPHLWANAEAKDLPKAITEAVDKAVPGAKIEKVKRFEIRAGLRFAAIDKAKVFYSVRMENDDKKVIKIGRAHV